MKVRVVGCKGLGAETDDHYEHFACSAAARAAGDRFETVAVLYEVRVRDGSHGLTNVRFIGGTGIP